MLTLQIPFHNKISLSQCGVCSLWANFNSISLPVKIGNVTAAIVGFRARDTTLTEGAPIQSVNLSISVAVQESVQVPLSPVQTSRGINIIRNAEIRPNTINQVRIINAGDDPA